jgi:hypothetical protein
MAEKTEITDGESGDIDRATAVGDASEFVRPQVISRPTDPKSKLKEPSEGPYVMILREDIQNLTRSETVGKTIEDVNFSKLWGIKLRELPMCFFSKVVVGLNEESFLPVSRVEFGEDSGKYNYSVEGSLRFKIGHRPVEICYKMDGSSGRFRVYTSQQDVEDISFVVEQLANFLNYGDTGQKLKSLVDNHFFQKVPLSKLEVMGPLTEEDAALPISILRFKTAMQLGTVVFSDRFDCSPVIIR